MDPDMENPETRAVWPPIEPAVALSAVDRVVERVRDSRGSVNLKTSLLLSGAGGLLAGAGMLAGMYSVKQASLSTPTPVTRSVETPTPSAGLGRSLEILSTPTTTPTTAPARTPTPAGKESTQKPAEVNDEVWNRLTPEQQQLVLKAKPEVQAAGAAELAERNTARQQQADKAKKDEIAQQQARQAAEEAARAAEYQFNQEINKDKVTIKSPADISGAGFQVGGEVLGTVWDVIKGIGPILVIIWAVLVGPLRFIRRVILRRGGGGGGRGRSRYGE